MTTTPRLHVAPDLAPGSAVELPEDQSHYLSRVLRKSVGEQVLLFNGRDGECLARIAAVGKRNIRLDVLDRTRAQVGVPDLWLLFAPLKKTRTDFVVEKATELGVRELHPVLTERTDAERVRTDRLVRVAVEAAEQTERLEVPVVHEAMSLLDALNSWNPDRVLLFCDEQGPEAAIREDGQPEGSQRPPKSILDAAAASRPAAVLVGPEGGFSPRERIWLHAHAFVQPVTLGPRILRAETAAIAALTLWQAAAGDWRKP